ncbi:restriction endonuclease [uncultured Lentilactobacillus sp.]|uniref:restriction endonuclease n=1 Tax=uncultured Lentilactobacillus sp. TaxID=2805375 RepID=UPI002597DD03|nr:restriction endonuclease [uncultured Lentilactobacillus sp.]
MVKYKRRSAERAILRALKNLGGSASRDALRNSIANDKNSGFTYEEVFNSVTSKNGGKYNPFLFDFNFGINNLYATGYVEQPQRMKDIILTEQGRLREPINFPTEKEQEIIDRYWKKRIAINKEKKKAKAKEVTDPVDANTDDDAVDNDSWKSELIDQLNAFTPGKFESFSRLLISKMGVRIDDKLGKIQSRDHGIDGFGYFESDEFRTTRVAIQSKKFANNPVSEPDIDKFKGVMDSFNAEYGIFITTSHFTDSAKEKAVQGSKSVTLIDGRRVAELVAKYQLHVTPVETFTLDDYYFQKD